MVGRDLADLEETDEYVFAHKSVLFGGQIKAAQISISSSQENPVCLVCSETVGLGVTKESETTLFI